MRKDKLNSKEGAAILRYNGSLTQYVTSITNVMHLTPCFENELFCRKIWSGTLAVGAGEEALEWPAEWQEIMSQPIAGKKSKSKRYTQHHHPKHIWNWPKEILATHVNLAQKTLVLIAVMLFNTKK
jgi:hypothetical protein